MFALFRCARPSDRLGELRRFYVDGLGCALLSAWVDHEGYDGLVVGDPAGRWQAEFIREHARPAVPVPSHEHLLVFYVADRALLAARADAMDAAGWPRVQPDNPYWQRHGVAYADPDGYHVVIAVPPGK